MVEADANVFVKSYWNYYLKLEEQFIATKKFVEFDASNFATYSIEYLKLLQATCSEIDVVAKIVAEWFEPSFKSIDNKNIQKWGFVIQNHIQDIGTLAVCFNNDFEIIPWRNWQYEKYQDSENHTRYRLISGCKTPCWWTAYNKVKHERTFAYGNGQTNYVRANLENLITAMAALYILETLFLSSIGGERNPISYPKSKLFNFYQLRADNSLRTKGALSELFIYREVFANLVFI